MLGEDFPLEVGDVGETAMLSLCAGGLVRTWTDKGTRLWQVQQAEILHGVQGRGVIGRTLREEPRFREVGLLVEDRGTLLLQSRFPVAADDESMQIETAPAPRGSDIWGPHIVPGEQSHTLNTPATNETIEAAPIVMMEAIRSWGFRPLGPCSHVWSAMTSRCAVARSSCSP
jgi:hypothetical protein